MAEVIWAEPALNDLDAIADYIALDNPEAARRLVQMIFEHVDLDLDQALRLIIEGTAAETEELEFCP